MSVRENYDSYRPSSSHHHQSISTFKKPERIPKYQNRDLMKQNLYDVYLDGFPVENVPVVVSNIPWKEYSSASHIFDKHLEGLSVFGIAKYGPTSKNPGATEGHIVVQFNYNDPNGIYVNSHAQAFFQRISTSVCYSTKLTVKYFGQEVEYNSDVRKYGYPGKIPKMGGLAEYMRITKSVSSQDINLVLPGGKITPGLTSHQETTGVHRNLSVTIPSSASGIAIPQSIRLSPNNNEPYQELINQINALNQRNKMNDPSSTVINPFKILNLKNDMDQFASQYPPPYVPSSASSLSSSSTVGGMKTKERYLIYNRRTYVRINNA